MGMRGGTLEAMLSAYKDELSQDRYTPAYAQRLRRRKVEVVSKKVKKKLNDDALLKKLEGLTAPDDDAPQKKAGARRR
jgi:hypothetical protein